MNNVTVLSYCVLNLTIILITHKDEETPYNTTSNQRGQRRQASSLERRGTGRLVWPALAGRLSVLGPLGWAGAGQKPHAGSSDGDTATELATQQSRGLVGARVVWEAMRNENLGLRRP